MTLKKRDFVGGLGTAAWGVMIAAFLVWKRADLITTDLGDWGGFIGGSSSALALLWLVLGYQQQAEDLKLNTKALELQAEELKHQVEETRALVRESQAQAQAATGMLELERQNLRDTKAREREQAKPRFVPAGGAHGTKEHRFTFRNVGAPIHSLRAACRDGGGIMLPVVVSPPNYLASEQEGNLHINQSLTYPLSFSISYRDGRGVEDTLRMSVDESYNFVNVTYDGG